MRCLIDAQLPPALARWLTAEGLDEKRTAVWPEVADAFARGESLIELV